MCVNRVISYFFCLIFYTMKHIFYFFLSLLIFTSCSSKSRKKDVERDQVDYYIQVIGVSDGDTFTGLTQEKIEIRFRIYGIDAPEKKQPFSNKSKMYLSDLIYKKRVGIKVQKKNDGYGRPIVWVYTPDGKEVGSEMLKAGMAWHSKQYDASERYSDLENYARTNKVGLWSDTDPVAPWDYRKMQKKAKE